MDVLDMLDRYEVEGTQTDNEFLTLCPFHNDTTPSCSINVEKGVFKCFACDAKGDIVSFLAGFTGSSRKAVESHIAGGQEDQTYISHNLIVNWHRTLIENDKMQRVLKTKGIGKNAIEKYLLGYDGKRITIPIYDTQGKPVNVRRYLPNAKKNKFLNMKGCGGAALFPGTRALRPCSSATTGCPASCQQPGRTPVRGSTACLCGSLPAPGARTAHGTTGASRAIGAGAAGSVPRRPRGSLASPHARHRSSAPTFWQ